MKTSILKTLFVLTISFLLTFTGCAINKNITETVKKDGYKNEMTTSDNSTTIERDRDSKLQNEYNEFLQKENEDILFSFSSVDPDKVIALCASEKPSYIVYRFGTSEHVKFEYPEILEDSWDKFIYSYYLRGGIENEGLVLNYVTFEHDGKEYKIFQEYSAESGSTEVGIRITDLKTYEETTLKAAEDSVKGNLIQLRDNDKIKKEEDQ